MKEPMYEVVWPLGKMAYEETDLAPRLSDFNMKTICAISDATFRSEKIFPMTRELLLKRYPGLKFVDYDNFGKLHSQDEERAIADLPEVLGCLELIGYLSVEYHLSQCSAVSKHKHDICLKGCAVSVHQ